MHWKGDEGRPKNVTILIVLVISGMFYYFALSTAILNIQT